MPHRRISEAETRKELIDPQLKKAGWYLRDKTKVGIEIPVDGYDAESWNGVTDYIIQHTFTTDKICFLTAVQSVFLQNADWKLLIFMNCHCDQLWHGCSGKVVY